MPDSRTNPHLEPERRLAAGSGRLEDPKLVSDRRSDSGVQSANRDSATSHPAGWQRAFTTALGLWLALALLKWGTPVILTRGLRSPDNFIEFLILSWPIEWGYALFLPVLVLGLKTARWRLPSPAWLVWLPAVWLGWQVLSASQTVDATLTHPVLTHFAVCVLTFYTALLALGRATRLRWFWVPLLGAFTLVLAVGWHQHFIGLEDTRRFFYQQPNWRDYPPEFLQKIASTRIYATLFYPNALAGVILLLAPRGLWALWWLTCRQRLTVRWAVVGAGFIFAAACLVWSGSKSGWLILAGVGVIALWHAPLSGRVKWAVAGLALVLALGGFAARYAGYFAKGATSASARLDYWRAAMKLAAERPLLGSGPGTFHVGYKRLKSPDAEMTRLAHNDYLEQAADSGIPGFLLFTVFMLGSIWRLHRVCFADGLSVSATTWLGVAAFAAQSVVEFGLYVPATAWVFFALLGWLWSRELTIESTKQSGS